MKKALFVFLISLVSIIPTFASAESPQIIFSDDFNATSTDSSKWHIPTWMYQGDGTYLGRTQLRVSQSSPLPQTSSGNVGITLETYNPEGFSFYGTDLLSNQTFTPGNGLSIKIRAKLNGNSPGAVGGLFLYDLKPGSNTLHDEIDFELVGNRPNEVQTNIYANEPLGAGHSSFLGVPGGIGEYHTYEIRWFKNAVSWYIDGNLIRTETNYVPQGPMTLHLNMWAPDQGWPEAYNANVNATTSPSGNIIYSTLVDFVSVETIPQTPTPTVQSILLTPGTGVTNPLIPTKISAVVLDQSGNTINNTPLTWTSSNPAVATVDQNGNVTGVTIGSTNITARSGNITSNTAIVNVLTPTITINYIPPIGAPLFSSAATGTAKNINPDDTALAVYIKVNGAWWVKPNSNAPLTPINPSGNWVAPVLTGGIDSYFSEIRAYLVPKSFVASGSQNASSPSSSLDQYSFASIIRNLPIASITLSPTTVNLKVNETSLLNTTARDQFNGTTTGVINYISSNPSIATVSTTGLVTGVGAGTTTITATSGSVTSNTVTVAITNSEPKIVITSVPEPLGSYPLLYGTVSGVNVNDYVVAIFTRVGQGWWNKPTWATPYLPIASNGVWGGIGMDGYAGEVRAYLVPKTFTIPLIGNGPIPTGMAPYIYASVIRNLPVQTIDLTPYTLALNSGNIFKLTATTRDVVGNTTIASTTFASSKPSVATVDQNGLVTALSSGTTTITAQSGSVVSNTAIVTVNGSPSIVFTSVPAVGSYNPIQGVVSGVNSGDYNVAIYIKVGNGWWNKPTFAAPLTAIGASGVFGGVVIESGASEIRGYLLPKTFTTSLIGGGALPTSLSPYIYTSATRNLPLSSISLEPYTIAIARGMTLQINAKTLDYYGNPTPATVTFISSNPSVASVNANGIITGVATGTATIVATSEGIQSNSVPVSVNGIPQIKITSLPANNDQYSSTNGTVSGVNSSLYDVAIFIRTSNGWWNKPTWAKPLTPIGVNGTWSVSSNPWVGFMLTPDILEVRAFLIPKTYTVPLMGGGDFSSTLMQFPYDSFVNSK